METKNSAIDPMDGAKPRKRLNTGDERRRKMYKDRSKDLGIGVPAPILDAENLKLAVGASEDPLVVMPISESPEFEQTLPAVDFVTPEPRKRLNTGPGDERRRNKFKEKSRNQERVVSAPPFNKDLPSEGGTCKT